MLRALKSLFGRRDPAQLVLELDAGQLRTADDLLARLRSLGLKRIATCRLTRNANVMVSWRGAELRVHERPERVCDHCLRAHQTTPTPTMQNGLFEYLAA